MEPHRGPQYRTALLPWEQQFCEAVGITTEEYFEFHDLVSQHIKEEKGRELIPDVRNEPVTIVTLVIGVALSAIGMLLAPKPQAPKQQERGGDFRGADRRARTKYAPLSEFDSVQELAALGTIIPLIFTRRDEKNKTGGVRVDSQMLWSKMVNKKTYQELYALLLFGAGLVEDRPDFEGYAFGSAKMSSYVKAKIALWFARGKANTWEPFRPYNEQHYEEDGESGKYVGKKNDRPFETYWRPDREGGETPQKMVFCGVVTPSQNAIFGQYSPIRNGQPWKYDFRWPGKGDKDADRKDIVRNTRQKHAAGYHAGRTDLVVTDDKDGIKKLTYTINYKQSTKVFMCTAASNADPNFETADHFYSGGDIIKPSDPDRDHFTREPSDDKDSFAMTSGGFEEGINAIDESKVDADVTLEVGELYLMGEAVYVCTGRENLGPKDDQGTPFEPERTGTVAYYFEIDEELTLEDVSDSSGLKKLEEKMERSVLTEGLETMRSERQCPIQRLAVGTISTTREVDMVEIGLKSTVYRQIQGYPNMNNFTDKDMSNQFAKQGGSYDLGSMSAYYDRVSLFRLQIRKGKDGRWKNWTKAQMFAVHGKNPKPSYSTIQIEVPEKDFYEFRFIPFCGNSWINRGVRENHKDRYKEYITRTKVYLLDSNQSFTLADEKDGYTVRIKGREVELHDVFQMSHPFWRSSEPSENLGAGRQNNPGSLLNDYWFFSADSPSHVNEPEHQITWINEYVDNSPEWYANPKAQYSELAYAGIVCQSSTEISSFSNFSAYFQKGIAVRRISEGPDYVISSDGDTDNIADMPNGATNNFPDIARDLLTNRRYGVGEMIGSNSVDVRGMQEAARFCKANGFYWDGILTEKTNVREFLFSQAGYQLLDFTIIGGQFSLKPSVPYGTDYKILNKAVAGSDQFPIKALFTNGNVRNFKTTFLSPEERQLFTAEVKYRLEPEANGFPEQRSMRVRLDNDEGGYFRDPVEVFDMSQFCTSRTHALNFAKYALQIRKHVDHAVSFETTPDAVHALAPGDYIRVAVSIQHQETNRGYKGRLTTGSISPEGIVQTTQDVGNGQEIYYWKPGTTSVSVGKLSIKDGLIVDSSLKGVLFTRKESSVEARVYKIESIAFSEDSFVEISATYVPLNKEGQMKTLQWERKYFVVEDQVDG